MAGALTLRHAIGYFPRGTIHVAVVDPGVGTPRRPLLIESDGSYFIGPDNGIFSLVRAGKTPIRIIEYIEPDLSSPVEQCDLSWSGYLCPRSSPSHPRR